MAGAAGYVTKTLIAINVAMAVLSVASAGGKGAFGGGYGGILGGETPLTDWGAGIGAQLYRVGGGNNIVLGPGGIYDGEYYRLLTSMFLHYGALHLAVNMWALWVLGRSLESVLGPVRFLALYLVSGLGGSVAVYFFTPYAAAVGASGAIFGLFAALFVVLKRLDRDASSLIPLLVINLAISFAPGISLAAHVGGLVTGAVVSLAMAYAPKANRNLVTTVVISGLCLLFTVAVVIQTQILQHLRPT
jgi:membrane associated rhomboid family serine protease